MRDFRGSAGSLAPGLRPLAGRPHQAKRPPLQIIFSATFISENHREHWNWLSPQRAATPISAFSEGKSHP